MRSNIDHDVFAKKLQSIELANQVEEFLKSQNLEEPVQIPFGHSGCNNDPQDWNRSPLKKASAQDTMRRIMSNSIQEDREKSEKNVSSRSQEQLRRVKNKTARLKAIANGKSVFTGQCSHHGQQIFKIKCNGEEHICLVCRDQHARKQTIKRRKIEGVA